MTFETIEWLKAVKATPQSFARRGAEATDFLCMPGPTTRAFGCRVALQRARCSAFRWWCNSIVTQLFPSRVSDPVGSPRRREHCLDFHISEACDVESSPDRCLNHESCRASRVGRSDEDGRRVGSHAANDAQIGYRNDRNLRVGYTGKDRKNPAGDTVIEERRRHGVTKPHRDRYAEDTAWSRADGLDARHDAPRARP